MLRKRKDADTTALKHGDAELKSLILVTSLHLGSDVKPYKQTNNHGIYIAASETAAV
jgi:hypothetical protein